MVTTTTATSTSAYDQIARHDPNYPSTATTLKTISAGEGLKQKKFELRYDSGYSPAKEAHFAAKLVDYDKAQLRDHNDAHFHATNYQQKGLNLDVVVRRMDQIKCKHSVIMPIPTSLISLSGDTDYVLSPLYHNCGEPYYVPTKYANATELTKEIMKEARTLVELGVESEVDDQTAFQYRELHKQDQDKLDPMITGVHLGSTYSDMSLYKKLLRNPGVFTGVGEITLGKELVEDLFAGKGQANLKNKIEPMAQLVGAIGVAGMPVTIHCDVDTPYKEDIVEGKPKNLEDFEKFLSHDKTQHTTIIWAHGGGLGRFVKEPKGHLDKMTEMMDKHKNLVLDISWSQVSKQLTGKNADGTEKPGPEKEAILNRWAGFIEKYSDRIMFGSDSLAPKSDAQWSETLRMYNEPNGLLSRLSKKAQHNVLEGSYEKHIMGAREDVRKFEKHVLPKIKQKLTDPSVHSLNLGALATYRNEVYAGLDAKALHDGELQKKFAAEAAKDSGWDFKFLVEDLTKVGSDNLTDGLGLGKSSTTASTSTSTSTPKAPPVKSDTIQSTDLTGTPGHRTQASFGSDLDWKNTFSEPEELEDTDSKTGTSTKKGVSFVLPQKDVIDVASPKVTTDTTDTADTSTTPAKEKTKAEKLLKKAGYYASFATKFKKYGPDDNAGGGSSGKTKAG